MYTYYFYISNEFNISNKEHKPFYVNDKSKFNLFVIEISDSFRGKLFVVTSKIEKYIFYTEFS